MTREEAILILEEEAEFLYGDFLHGDAPYNKTAFDMAIEALQERPHGEWEEYTDCEGKTRTITCSECGWEEHSWIDTNFCPNCGARMVKGGDTE